MNLGADYAVGPFSFRSGHDLCGLDATEFPKMIRIQERPNLP